ncbi:DnaB-like helicase C-terminal domain-containing protein [Castellaniella sp.]|uniref:DnaB-like helicase C-terminal domain-containing protein n=1 Tax=Castellaniella sp. TaxID=1955812 RepID=UPI002AFEC0E0|nr:DnaB-like helicase C-terminal domain-containing protein [Castellaniella sp.]
MSAVPVATSSPAALPTIYEFDEDFQSKITALVLRDTSFMQQVEGLILPQYFESETNAALVNMGLRYFDKYRKCPGDKTIIGDLIKHDIISKVVSKEVAAASIMYVAGKGRTGLFDIDISDRDYVIEQVAQFAKHQAISAAILDSVGFLDARDFDRIEAAITKAANVGRNDDGGSYDYTEMIESRTEERLLRAAGKLPPTGVTTGYPEIDRLLHQRGWGRKELSVLMGPAKGGKSTALLNFGIAATAAVQRYNVLYVTLEVSAKITAERADARIAEVAMNQLGANTHAIKAAVEKFKLNSGKFIIHEYPTGVMRVSDLRRLLERYKAKGIKFDLVIVDYADLMQPERVTDNTIENSKSVYVNLRGLAMMEDVAVLTATQTNRDGAKKAVATMTDVAEDFNKIRIADVVISINRTEEEKALKQARLFFAACRNQADGFSVRIAQELDKMIFISEVIGEE